jgi:hypothetical protein
MDLTGDLTQKLRFLSQKKSAPEIDILERAYSILTILDSKASALMTVNAFLAAFPALSIERYRAAHDRWGLWLSLLLIIALVISALLCFAVVRIQWRWLQHIDPGAGDRFCDQEIEELVNAILARTARYRWAWRTTLVCVLGMIALALHYAMG